MTRKASSTSGALGTVTSFTLDYASYTPVLNDFIVLDLHATKATSGAPADPTTPTGFTLIMKTTWLNGVVASYMWTYGRFASGTSADNPPAFSGLTSTTWAWMTTIDSGLDPAHLPSKPTTIPGAGQGINGASGSTLTDNTILTVNANDVIYSRVGIRCTSGLTAYTWGGGLTQDIAPFKNGVNMILGSAIETVSSPTTITPSMGPFNTGAGSSCVIHSFSMQLAVVTGTGQLTLSGSGADSGSPSPTGALTLSGSGTTSTTATGSLSLSGSATPSTTATAAIALSGSSVASTKATASVTLSGSATDSASPTSSATMTLGASGTDQASPAATGSLTLSAAATDTAAATASGSITLGASAADSGSATGSASLTLSGLYTAGTIGTATISLTGTGLATVAAAGAASLSLSASGTTSTRSAGTATLSLTANAAPVAPLTGLATLSLSGTGIAVGSISRDITVITQPTVTGYRVAAATSAQVVPGRVLSGYRVAQPTT